MRVMVALFIALFSVSASANPTVFGLEIGKTTVSQLEAQYNASRSGTNKYTQGPMFEISPSQIDFEGLQNLTVIFSSDGLLVGVLTTFPKSKFDYLHNVLNQKYRKVSEKIPFVGDKSASYRDNQTNISLKAPHLSFKMSMNYIHEDLDTAFNRQTQAEEQAQKQRESSQL